MSEAAKIDDSLPPFRPLPQKPPKVTVEHLDDGSVTIASDYSLEGMPLSVPHMLEEAARLYPSRNFIGERDIGEDRVRPAGLQGIAVGLFRSPGRDAEEAGFRVDRV